MPYRLKMSKIQSIFALRQQGWPFARIARELGVHRQTVARHVRGHSASRGGGLRSRWVRHPVSPGEFLSKMSRVPLGLRGAITRGPRRAGFLPRPLPLGQTADQERPPTPTPPATPNLPLLNWASAKRGDFGTFSASLQRGGVIGHCRWRAGSGSVFPAGEHLQIWPRAQENSSDGENWPPDWYNRWPPLTPRRADQIECGERTSARK